MHSVCFFYDVDDDAIATAEAAGLTVVYQVGSVSTLVLVPQVVDAVTMAMRIKSGRLGGRPYFAGLRSPLTRV